MEQEIKTQEELSESFRGLTDGTVRNILRNMTEEEKHLPREPIKSKYYSKYETPEELKKQIEDVKSYEVHSEDKFYLEREDITLEDHLIMKYSNLVKLSHHIDIYFGLGNRNLKQSLQVFSDEEIMTMFDKVLERFQTLVKEVRELSSEINNSPSK